MQKWQYTIYNGTLTVLIIPLCFPAIEMRTVQVTFVEKTKIGNNQFEKILNLDIYFILDEPTV